MRPLNHLKGQIHFAKVLCFMTHFAVDTSWVSDFLHSAFGVSLFPKTVSKVKGIEAFTGKKAKSDEAISQHASSEGMVMDKGDVFNVPTTLGRNRIVNDKAAVLQGAFSEIQEYGYLHDHFVHERAPSGRHLLESVKGVFSSQAPVIPTFLTESVDSGNLQQGQKSQEKEQVPCTIAVFLSDFTPAQLGPDSQHSKHPVKSRLENIFLFSQVIFDFPFEFSAIRGMHCAGLLLLVLFVISKRCNTTKRSPLSLQTTPKRVALFPKNYELGCET
jgi:hypothetical protein